MPAREPDPYAVLGIPQTASRPEVARAYRGLAKQHHPDVTGGDTDPMRKVNWAWHVLSDPARRAAWDAAHEIPRTGHWDADRSPRSSPVDEWSTDAGWMSWAEYRTDAARVEPMSTGFNFGCAPLLLVVGLLLLFVLFAGLGSPTPRDPDAVQTQPSATSAP